MQKLDGPKNRRIKKILSMFLKVRNLRKDHILKVRKRSFEEFKKANNPERKNFSYKKQNKFRFFSQAENCIENLKIVPESLPEKPQKLLKKILFDEQDKQWRKTAYKSAHSILRYHQVKQSTQQWKHVEKGDFQTSKLISQLRLDWDFLNSTGFRYKISHSPNCDVCNVVENRRHFLMTCKRFSEPRKKMFDCVKALVFPEPVSLEILLGGGNLPLWKKYEIQNAVKDFILSTGRHKEGYSVKRQYNNEQNLNPEAEIFYPLRCALFVHRDNG